MAEEKDPLTLKKELLAALDEAINQGPWDKSLFLTTTIKPLRDLREKLREDLAKSQNTETTLSGSHKQAFALKPGYVEVYILLYTAKGSLIRNWESALNALTTSSINRPIYKNEEDIKNVIRQKTNKQNEAYACVTIREEDLRPPISAVASQDRLGYDLLSVKQGSVLPENITRFMHISGKYRFKNGTLRRENDMDYADYL